MQPKEHETTRKTLLVASIPGLKIKKEKQKRMGNLFTLIRKRKLNFPHLMKMHKKLPVTVLPVVETVIKPIEF